MRNLVFLFHIRLHLRLHAGSKREDSLQELLIGQFLIWNFCMLIASLNNDEISRLQIIRRNRLPFVLSKGHDLVRSQSHRPIPSQCLDSLSGDHVGGEQQHSQKENTVTSVLIHGPQQH